MLNTLVSCGQENNKVKYQKPKKDLSKLSKATFASGCFWCGEAVFESVKGVEEAVSGYAGGKEPNPTYEQVGAHQTGHAESVEVYYDSSVVSYPTLLKVYFGSEDPTQVNGQGPDIGTPYRSIIFYRNEQEKQQALAYKSELQKNTISLLLFLFVAVKNDRAIRCSNIRALSIYLGWIF